MVNGDWKVQNVTSKHFNQSSQFHILIIDETALVLLDSFADPHSNGIEIKFPSEGLPRV
jgi:hypothetical protein